MKSFIAKMDGGKELIITLKYYSENNKFRVFLHSMIDDNKKEVKLYEENRSFYIEPNRISIFDETKKLINSSNYVWTYRSQMMFRDFLWNLWKECHKNLFNSEDYLIDNGTIPQEFSI